MKYLGVLCGLVFLIGCEPGEPTTFVSDLGSYGELYETVSFSNVVDGASLDVMIMGIEDSRCFSDAVCMHSGWGSVNFEIMGVPSFSLKVDESHAFSFNGKAFKLKLTDIVPYPNTTNQAQRKEAVFSIDRL